MNAAFFTGLVGACTLVIGSAWPEREGVHPARSTKNRLFAVGNILMFSYSLLSYLSGGSVLFVILQVFVNSTSVLMLLDVPDKYDVPFVATVGSAMILWSLTLFQGHSTIIFIAGLSCLGLGFSLQTATVRRNAMLAIGSITVAVFSHMQNDVIFLWLNVFFAIFSAYHAWNISRSRKVTS